MCCAAGTQVQANFNEQSRPCGLNSLICCQRTYDDSILGSVLLRLLHLLDEAVSKPIQMLLKVGNS